MTSNQSLQINYRPSANTERTSPIKVHELLNFSQLRIPNYQRPYQWTLKNVNQLIDDILHFKDKSAYRLGTIVCHRNVDESSNEEVLDIVDGQQRTVTLTLIALALSESPKFKDFSKPYSGSLSILEQLEFQEQISRENIAINYKEIQRRIIDFDLKTIEFFFNNCEVITITISSISEAFQFFDSQNARGKDLDPHDLLKAYHLREIDSDVDDDKVKAIVADWEEQSSRNLSQLFSQKLYRIRNWSKGNSAKYFSKEDIDEFKGIRLGSPTPMPFEIVHRIVHEYITDTNSTLEKVYGKGLPNYPFQIDQTLINGIHFFELAAYYIELSKSISATSLTQKLEKESFAFKIMSTLDSYKGHYRTGDKYTRSLFDNTLLYYIDRFGHFELERAIEKIFVWAYAVRFEKSSVRLSSVDNHAISNTNMFKVIRDAMHPSAVLNIKVPVVGESKDQKLEPLNILLSEMQYLES